MQTRREALRASTLQEIRDAARKIMCRGATTDVSLSAVAREMLMSPPALYRYYDGRDALLTALVTDAFHDLATALHEARDAVPEGDIGGRALAVAVAYRRWAHDEPQQFTLIFGTPIPGYAAPEDGPTTGAAQRALGVVLSTIAAAAAAGRLGPPLVPDLSPGSHTDIEEWDPTHGLLTPMQFAAGVHGWMVLHGFVILEAYGLLGHKGSLADGMFLAQVRVFFAVTGLPAPDNGWPEQLPGA